MPKIEIITKYFPELTASQIAQFEQMERLYILWNEQINVISRKDIESLYEKHVLHSLSIARACSFDAGARILDVGCGGGFPGIPLAVMFPQAHFTMVDSIGKKIKVVDQVAQELNLTNVTAIHDRVENIHQNFDFVVSRAVTRMAPFTEWVWDKITRASDKGSLPNGILYLKGGDLTEELAEAGKPYKEYMISDWFREEFFETKKVIYIKK